jgi:hypothetical protein
MTDKLEQPWKELIAAVEGWIEFRCRNSWCQCDGCVKARRLMEAYSKFCKSLGLEGFEMDLTYREMERDAEIAKKFGRCVLGNELSKELRE